MGCKRARPNGQAHIGPIWGLASKLIWANVVCIWEHPYGHAHIGSIYAQYSKPIWTHVVCLWEHPYGHPNKGPIYKKTFFIIILLSLDLWLFYFLIFFKLI